MEVSYSSHNFAHIKKAKKEKLEENSQTCRDKTAKYVRLEQNRATSVPLTLQVCQESSVNFVAFATGTCYSWTSPFLPKFESSDLSINPISRPITTTEAGLLVSIINLGLLIGPLIPALITKKLGKKKTLLLSAAPLLAAHLICMLAKTIEVFLVARFIMGLATGAAWSVIPGYIAEISEPEDRGFLSSFIAFMSTSGGLLGFCIGPFLSMKWFSIVNLIPVTVFLALVFFFVPESPYDLIKQNNFKKAQDSLLRLRKGTNVHNELLKIQKSIESEYGSNNGKFMDLFRSVSLIKAMIIGNGIMIVSPLSGIWAVVGYTQTIFNLAGSSIPSEYSAIIVSSIAVVSTTGQSYLVDRLGRKILTIISCIMILLSMSTLGTYFFLQQNNYKLDSLSWVPLCSLVVYMVGFYTGLASVPYILIGELFPSNVKAVASSFCTTVNFTITFILTLIFPYLLESIGIAYTFWLIAFFMALGVFFCITFIPETKGKSLQEITEMLNNHRKS